jgi:hypothetical protein
VLAGFGVVRFLKSSANDAEGATDTGASNSRRGSASKYLGAAGNSSQDTGYRDEFTK